MRNRVLMYVSKHLWHYVDLSYCSQEVPPLRSGCRIPSMPTGGSS